MGNSNIDTSHFPLSQEQWQPANDPRTLVCPSTSTSAHFTERASISEEDINIYTYRSLYKQYLVSILAIISKAVPSGHKHKE